MKENKSEIGQSKVIEPKYKIKETDTKIEVIDDGKNIVAVFYPQYLKVYAINAATSMVNNLNWAMDKEKQIQDLFNKSENLKKMGTKP